MNKVLTPMSSASALSSSTNLYSDFMLFELLAMHEELIGELRLECREGAGSADLLTDMIDEHEKAAVMLRVLLHNHQAEVA